MQRRSIPESDRMMSIMAMCLFLFLNLFLQLNGVLAQSVCQNLDPSPELAKFVDSLPLPGIIDLRRGSKKPLVLGAYKINQKLHRDLPATTLYGYGTSPKTATYPGPTILAMRHVAVKVKWENHITDATHILSVDRSISIANPRAGVPIVTHLHGGEVHSNFDGNPQAWFTATGEKGSAYKTDLYVYRNEQFPTLLWYHDHAMGRTRLNVFAGLAGLYILTSSEEQNSKLPNAFSPFHVPLVIQDKQFFANGSLNFPTTGSSPEIHPSWCPEFFGDTLLVNGKAWPFLAVRPSVYRFRILNGANARFFKLSFSVGAILFTKIGTDGGFLSTPFTASTITLAPGERADVLVNFSSLPIGTQVILQNFAPAPFPIGSAPSSRTASVMQFIVVRPFKSTTSPPLSNSTIPIPTMFGPNKYPPRPSITTRTHILSEIYDSDGQVTTVRINNLTFLDPVTETPKQGTTEIWEIVNLTPDAHPIHLHLVRFRMINQQVFDIAKFKTKSCSLKVPFAQPNSCFTKAAISPDKDQQGWKDTIVVWPGFVTRILITFSGQGYFSFPFDPTTGPGYVWHCHIVDHEDNDMMRPLVVVR